MDRCRQITGETFVMHNKACFICGSFDHVQAHCKYHQRERMVYGNNYNKAKAVNTARPKAVNPARHVKRGRDTKISQSSGPPVKVGDEVVHKELGDRMEKAATTASSLEAEQDIGCGSMVPRYHIGGVDAQTRIDNGTEFVNQTLREYYEKVGISHETSVARSLHQNGVVERRNRTLIEAARTMLIYTKASLFLWAEAVATACYTQNRSIIRLRHGKTPYELLHDKLPDLSFFHVFCALCYPTNDSENLRKLQPKADIDFDELTAMASKHSSSGPALHERTPAIISLGLVPNPSPSTSLLLEPLDIKTVPPSSTIVDQDAPSPSNSQTTPETQSPIILNDVEENNHDLDVAYMNNDPFFELGHTGHVGEIRKLTRLIINDAAGEKIPKPKYVKNKADPESSPKKKFLESPVTNDDDDEVNVNDDEVNVSEDIDDLNDDNVDNEGDDDQDDDNEENESNNDDDDFVHPKLSTFDEKERQNEEDKEEEWSDDEEYDKETQGVNVEGEELDEEETNEEEEANELYIDVNINLERRDAEITDDLQTNVQGFISNMLNPNSNTGIDSILNMNTESTSLIDVPVSS
ncbi:retrovirus-related pol polyprotein from transposon TNT 1-94 [Tanacetum coccineum]